MNDRERQIIYMALAYMEANIDDVNDAFASSDEDDPDNEEGRVALSGGRPEPVVIESPTADEVRKLAGQFALQEKNG